MNSAFDTYRPDGFGTVNSYLFVENPLELIDFLTKVFFAEEVHRTLHPTNGDISNSIIKIGTSCIMLSQARGQFLGMNSALYLYVADVDTVHKRAVEYGAEVVFEAADMDYGDRQSGIVDPSGNYWWISNRFAKKGYEE